MLFEQWIEELYKITSKETGIEIRKIKINQEQALQWYNDGFTPYQCFRETWDNENDSEY